MKENAENKGLEIAESYGLSLTKRSISLLKVIEAQPGSTVSPRTPPRASIPNVLIYKVMGKMFAIMSIRGNEEVILKCDANRALFLREQYEGIGHRSHLDPRTWINVKLDSGIPTNEIKKMVVHSYQQVCAKLTKKQIADLLDL